MTTVDRKKAVAVAEDVLKHVAGLKLTMHNYIRAHVTLEEHLPAGVFENDGPLQPHIDVVAEQCHVCAIGAAVVSAVRLFDDCSVRKIFSRHGVPWVMQRDLRQQLAGLFDVRDLGLIESAFECDPTFMTDNDLPGHDEAEITADAHGAAVFGCRYVDPHDRLAAIMRNVVDNGGTFVVPPATYREYADAYSEYRAAMRAQNLEQS